MVSQEIPGPVGYGRPVATTVQDMLGDFEAAIERVRAAGSTDEERRALNDAIGCLYMLRSHFEGDPNYYASAGSSTDGRVTEGLSLIRGKMVHDFTAPLAPKSMKLVPGAHLYPSQDLHPGENLSWLPGDLVLESRLVDRNNKRSVRYDAPRFADYKSLVGGYPVLQSLRQAMAFFKGLALQMP